MKRERLTQIVLVIVGQFNLPQIYFLYVDLWHSAWLLEGKCECGPMFLSFFIPAGVFLLIAARKPSEHRSMIALAAWWNISHGAVMAIQTVESWNHGVQRNLDPRNEKCTMEACAFAPQILNPHRTHSIPGPWK